MKKVIISAAFIAAVIASTTVVVMSHCNSKTIFAANVEALTQEEGTKVDYCYIDNHDYGKWESAVFCSSQTNSSTIYPCEHESWGYKCKGQTDRCTK